MSKKKNVPVSLEQRLLTESNIDEMNEIVELFNVNLQKKNIIRSAKLSEVQDKVVQQMADRLDYRADEFSNDDLIKYHKVIQDTLDKSDTTMDNVKTPTIQINQQVNVDTMGFNSESRKRILDALTTILGNSEAIPNNATFEEVESSDDKQFK